MSLDFSTGCQSRKQILPFETISQDDGFYTGRGHREEKPALLIITDPDEVDKPGLDVQFPLELTDQLRRLDYGSSFAILVLQVLKGSTGFAVIVKKIVRQGNQVTIEAEFVEPSSDTFRIWSFTSPYHLVAVFKKRDWGQEEKFMLIVDGESVAETTYSIP